MTELVLMGDPRVAAIPANESGDELIDTRSLAGLASTPDVNPQNSAYAFLRRSVAERLLLAQEALPEGLGLLIAEGYRPYEQQEFYFNRRKHLVVELDPALTDSGAHLKASEYISPPDIAPHVSGAAVDITLIDETGAALDMGTAIDATPEESDNGCYFAAENISTEARANREVMAAALSHAGLVNYPTEWWHWSYGDRYWALMTGQAYALFGPVRADGPHSQDADEID